MQRRIVRVRLCVLPHVTLDSEVKSEVRKIEEKELVRREMRN